METNNQTPVEAITGAKVCKAYQSAVLVKLENGLTVLVPAQDLTGKTRPERDARLAAIAKGEVPVPPLVVSEVDGKLRGVELDEYNRRQQAKAEHAQYEERKAHRAAKRKLEETVAAMGNEGKLVEGATIKKVDENGLLVEVVEGVQGRVHFTELRGGRTELARLRVGGKLDVVVLPTHHQEIKDGDKSFKVFRVPLSSKLAYLQKLAVGQTMSAQVVGLNGDEFKLNVNGVDGVLPHANLGSTPAESLGRTKNQMTKVRFVALETREVEGRHGAPATIKLVGVFAKA
ncbi:MAG TPA: hypothetical protein V6C81_21665 [Planktothrix sp.]|jgi:hypothetical protein